MVSGVKGLKLAALAGASLAALAASPAAAQDRDWTGAASSDWFAPGNWTPAGPPTGADDVEIDTDTPNPTVIATPAAESGDIVIAGTSGSMGRLTIQSGGRLATSGDAYVGTNPGAIGNAGAGTVLVTGAGSAWSVTGALNVGKSGTGTGSVTIENGASLTSGSARIATGTASGATAVLLTGAGSIWSSGALVIDAETSNSQTDLLTISGGARLDSTSSTQRGGIVRVTGAGSVWNTGAFNIGRQGGLFGLMPAPTSLIIQDGGIVNSTSVSLRDVSSVGAGVTVEGAGSAWNVSGALSFGEGETLGANSLIIRNGGTVNVAGGSGSLFLGTNPAPGYTPSAIMFIGGGLGPPAPGTLNAFAVSIGANSSLFFDHNATDYVFAPEITGNGTVAINRGTTILTANSTAFTGGTTIAAGATLQLGTFGVTGGPIGVGSGGATGALSGDIANDGALIISRSTSPLALDGIISGTGTVTQRGNPATTVSAQNTYTGATTISGGGFFVTGSIASSSGVTVNGGGRLGGTGTVAQTTVTGGGGLLPGAPLPVGAVAGALGTLSVNGALTLTNANYVADIGAATADRIDVDGAATLAGRLAAVADDGASYAPGQYTLLTATGSLSGSFGALAIVGNFGGLAASLSYSADSVLLDLAPFAGTGEERWLADPATSLWNTASNWDPAAVPDGTARFGPSTRTTLTFAPGTTQIGRLLFDADAPAYAFNLDTRIMSQGGGSSLNILGDGVVNNSASRPTFFVTAATSVLDGGGGLNFFNASSAGNARISSFNSGAGINNFATTFYGTSTAADALIENVGSGTAFRESSTAGDAMIDNGAGFGFGGSAFFDDSDAGTAAIDNEEIGGLAFFDNASAADATILNHATSGYGFGRAGDVFYGIRFADSSTAGNAVITNDIGSTGFLDTSSAGTATIVNSNAGAGSFLVSTSFLGNSSAGSANITNNAGGATAFGGSATAASATIVNNGGGRTSFTQSAQGAGATIVNNVGGEISISDPAPTAAPSVAIGSLSGAGDVSLGSRNLELGALGGNATIGGVIADGGSSGGTGGSLTKVGAGTLILAGANTYTGATTISAGTLQLGDGGASGSLAGDIVNNSALAIDRTGALSLGGVISGTGGLALNGTVTTTLSGANTYTGATTVNAGTLLVTGSIAGSAVTVSDGATLGGTGTVGTTAIGDGGTLSPGLSIGTLTIDGDLAFDAGGSLFVEVDPAAADLVTVTGLATLDGTLTALGTGGAYSPGQFTLLTADGGLTGTFGSLSTQGSFGGLSATLAYDASNVFLILAGAAGAIRWRADPGTGNWNTGTNWEGDVVPADIAIFGPSTRTTIDFSPGTTTIGTIQFEAGAPAYTFNIGEGNCTAPGCPAGGDIVEIVGAGIVNNSAAQQTFGIGAFIGSSMLNFRNASSAGNATILGRLNFGQLPGNGCGTGINALACNFEGGVNFYDTSTAGSASFSGDSGGIFFHNASSAGNAIVEATLFGATLFYDDSSAANATLTNREVSKIRFFDSATAANAQIDNSDEAELTFHESSTASNATIVNSAGIGTGNPQFRIFDVNLTLGGVGFFGSSSAGATHIDNNAGGLLLFSESASASDATILNSGWTSFSGGTVGSATITNENGGRVYLGGSTEADMATILNNAGAAVELVSFGGSPELAIGTLSGPGDVFLGERTLVMLGLGGDAAIGGTIADGGTFEGTGGALTWAGDATLTLTGTNTYTGGTTITAGALQLGDGGETGSIVGDIVNDAAFVIDRTGTLALDGIMSGSGTLTQNGTVTTTLGGDSTYTGATIVNGGTLLVSGSIASDVTVNDGATLGGTGTVGATSIADGGTVAPGLSIGTLNLSGDLSFASDSRFLIEVAPDSSDLLAITGSAALAGTLDATDTGGTYTSGQRYAVLTADDGITGTFGAFTLQGDFSGLAADLSYDANSVFLVLASPGPTNTATTFQTDAIVFNEPTIVVERISLFETRIVGRLAGGVALFDETFNAAFDSPTVQNGLQAARTAITSAGGPGVIVLVSDPVLVSRTVTSSTASVSAFTLAGMSDTITTTTTFGPATVTIGDARSCGAAIAALPSGTRPACGEPEGQAFEVDTGTVNINAETHTDYFVDEVRTDTITETVSETYELTGTVVSVGNIHAAALSGVYDLAERLLFRVGQEGAPGLFGESAQLQVTASNLVSGGGGRGWAEAYGFRNRADARGGLPAERRDARGLAGGFSYGLGNGVVLGFGVDHGWLDLDVPDAMETADIELTQFALGARFGGGPFSLALSASYGFGSVDSERSLVAVSTASYDVDFIGLFAEASYRFDAGAWRVVPKLGIDHVRIDSEGFTESGMLGLAVPSHDSDRTRLFPGVEFGRSFAIGHGGALDLSGSVRYLAVVGGEERALPVAFTVAPGTPLVMRGLSERDSALVGAQARLRLTPSLDLYLAYDGRFAGGYDSHGATAGLKFVW